MITWFHFVRLLDPAEAPTVAAALRASLGPRAEVGRPADAAATAGWCLSVVARGPSVEALAPVHDEVVRVLAGRARVHKHWAFATSPS